jgi:hypothetical protein
MVLTPDGAGGWTASGSKYYIGNGNVAGRLSVFGRFADTDPDDIGNFTNRSPYPTLHLLREESIDRAVEAFPEAEMIYETNIETLDKLGAEGWKKLDVGPTP